MHLHGQKQTREEYFKTQIEASNRKFRFCKVSTCCVETFREVIYRSNQGKIDGPILCLGTRNGRELDIFRKYFFGGTLTRFVIRLLERKRYAFSSIFPFIESLGKSDVNNIDSKSVIGVELNPNGRRKDVLTGSFDELPREWTNKFNIVFSNSFDHAQDPYKTMKEWSRVIATGGYLIVSYPGESVDSSSIDPVGKIALEDIKSLFPGELIYYNKFGNIFRDAIFRKTV